MSSGWGGVHGGLGGQYPYRVVASPYNRPQKSDAGFRVGTLGRHVPCEASLDGRARTEALPTLV